VRHLSLRIAVAGLVLLGTFGGPACAQSIRSQMGPQARATISISVSVRPMFTVSAPADTVKVSTNASSALRYSVMVQSTLKPAPSLASAVGQDHPAGAAFEALAPAPDALGRAHDDRGELVLIVPD
jgi:hypothetical protein